MRKQDTIRSSPSWKPEYVANCDAAALFVREVNMKLFVGFIVSPENSANFRIAFSNMDTERLSALQNIRRSSAKHKCVSFI